MNKLKKTALATVHVAAAIGSMSSATTGAVHSNESKSAQIDINRLSLNAIEQSWLSVPRVCKAAAFNAQPIALPTEARSESVQAIYENFFT